MSAQLGLDLGSESTESGRVRVQTPLQATLRDGTPVPQCEWCGALIRGKVRDARFCKPAHRVASWHARRADAESEKKRLKALNAERCHEEITIARWAALMCLFRYRVIIVSHVREYLEERGIRLAWSLNWPGSLFQHPWFEVAGRQTTFHAEANARKVNAYRLSAQGHAAGHAILGRDAED